MARWKRALLGSAAIIIAAAGGVAALADSSMTPPQANGPVVQPKPITSDLNVTAVNVAAPAAELIDAGTGQVLYAHNVLAKHYPASLVKLMTSLIALEGVKRGQLKMNSIVPVSQAAYKVATTPGLSVAYLNPYERITLSKMLAYMYVVSADDAAVAIADDIAGSESAFARLMNAKARTLHMTHTHYTNASGLQNPNQYTTAYDLGTLSRYLIAHYPIVLKYASERGMYIHPGQYGTNYDQLLGQFSGLDGLKTGSTSEAGYCFVGTATRHGHRLISVILDTSSFPNVFAQTSTLLGWGFTQFQRTLYWRAGVPLKERARVAEAAAPTLQIAPRSDIYVELMKGKRQRVQTQLSLLPLKAPIARGQRVGTENVIMGGQIVEKVPVYAAQNDPRAGFVARMWRALIASAHQGAKRIVNWTLTQLHHYVR